MHAQRRRDVSLSLLPVNPGEVLHPQRLPMGQEAESACQSSPHSHSQGEVEGSPENVERVKGEDRLREDKEQLKRRRIESPQWMGEKSGALRAKGSLGLHFQWCHLWVEATDEQYAQEMRPEATQLGSQ